MKKQKPFVTKGDIRNIGITGLMFAFRLSFLVIIYFVDAALGNFDDIYLQLLELFIYLI